MPTLKSVASYNFYKGGVVLEDISSVLLVNLKDLTGANAHLLI